jgi:hypothetical protein
MKYLKIKEELREELTSKNIVICSVPFENDLGYIDVIDYAYAEEYPELEVVEVEIKNAI